MLSSNYLAEYCNCQFTLEFVVFVTDTLFDILLSCDFTCSRIKSNLLLDCANIHCHCTVNVPIMFKHPTEGSVPSCLSS